MTTENNKLIAEFMGIDQVDIDTWLETNSNLHYHTSWDWLMPVIEKIQDKHLENPKLDYDYIDEIRLAVPNIQEAYYLVLEFIKEHNN
jgi:hypothetical protein